MPEQFPIGSVVRVREHCHREGEIGTVVFVPASIRAELVDIPGATVPVAFAHVSGSPLWYGPEELDVITEDGDR